MSSLRAGAVTIAAAGVLALALGAGAGAAGEEPRAGGGSKPVIFDLFGTKLVEPETIFLTANSGPYIDDLVWSKWGRKGAKGTGTFVSDCVSCPPPDRRAAEVKLGKAVNCRRRGGKVFRRFKLTTGADYTGEPKTIGVYTGHATYCPKKG